MSQSIKFLNKIIQISPQQYDVVTYPIDQSVCIISCAGSGKTTTITSKIAYMIQYLKCNPEDFFIATFTKNAANDMKNKIKSYIGNIKLLCGTFHSIGYGILKKIAPKMLPQNMHIDESQYIFYNFLLTEESNDFKNKIKYIFVDEYQDINQLQFNIIKELYNKSKLLVVVGDDAQNIYTFRGSKIDYILNFTSDFDNSVIKHLNINYRSSNGVINIANECTKRMNKSIKKEMIPHWNIDYPVELIKFDNLNAEINYVGDQIKKNISEGIKGDNIAILCRNNQPLYFVEELLTKLGIKNVFISSEFKTASNYVADHVTITSIHGSKGLEWDIVYLIGMNDEYFPTKKNPEAIEEERRLFYVAVTRCKNKLILTYGKSAGICRFIDELPSNLFVKSDKSTDINFVFEKLKNEKYITNIIKRLNGDDYMYLRENKIIPSITPVIYNYYYPYDYPVFVKNSFLYTEFGSFVDYMIRRMIAEYCDKKNDLSNINIIENDPYTDNRASEILMSVNLNKSEQDIYDKYRSFIHNIMKNHRNVNRNIVQIELTKSNIKMKATCKEKIYYILNKLIALRNFYENDNIMITNRSHIPLHYLKEYRKCYRNYTRRNIEWKNIIYDTFLVSKCHAISFNRKKSLYVTVNYDDIIGLAPWLYDIEKYVKQYIINHYVLSNPSVGNGLIGGDADIIISTKADFSDSTIIDIKNSQNNEVNLEHIIQLLAYTQLARERNIKVNRIEIFNPLHGNQFIYDVSEWNGEKLINYLIEKAIED